MLILTGLIISGYLGYFFGYLKYIPSKNPADWGTFGDFVGGLINPLIGLAGLYMLVTTLRQNQRVIEQAESSLIKMEEALKQSEQALKLQKDEFELTRKEHEGSREAQEQLASTNAESLRLNITVNRIDRLLVAEKRYSEQVAWILEQEINAKVFVAHGENYSSSSSFSLRGITDRWRKNPSKPVAFSDTAINVVLKLFDAASIALDERNGIIKELIFSYSSIELDSSFLKAGEVESIGRMLSEAIYSRDDNSVDTNFPKFLYKDGHLSRKSALFRFLEQHSELMAMLDYQRRE
jgi:hypothetical protein